MYLSSCLFRLTSTLSYDLSTLFPPLHSSKHSAFTLLLHHHHHRQLGKLAPLYNNLTVYCRSLTLTPAEVISKSADGFKPKAIRDLLYVCMCMNMYIENGQSSSRFRLTFLSLSLSILLCLSVSIALCAEPGLARWLPCCRLGAHGTERPNWQTGARCSKVSHGGIKRIFCLNLLFIWFQSCFSSCKVMLNIVFFGDTFFL